MIRRLKICQQDSGDFCSRSYWGVQWIFVIEAIKNISGKKGGRKTIKNNPLKYYCVYMILSILIPKLKRDNFNITKKEKIFNILKQLKLYLISLNEQLCRLKSELRMYTVSCQWKILFLTNDCRNELNHIQKFTANDFRRKLIILIKDDLGNRRVNVKMIKLKIKTFHKSKEF